MLRRSHDHAKADAGKMGVGLGAAAHGGADIAAIAVERAAAHHAHQPRGGAGGIGGGGGTIFAMAIASAI